MPKHTKASIRRLLNDTARIRTPFGWMAKGDYAAMRGVARIYASQLADEKAIEGTRHDNRIGFGHNYSLVGSRLGAILDGGQKDGVMRQRVTGYFPNSPWVKRGTRHDGSIIWGRRDDYWKPGAGQSHLAFCHRLAHHHAQQLADFANGDKRHSVAKVRASEGK